MYNQKFSFGDIKLEILNRQFGTVCEVSRKIQTGHVHLRVIDVQMTSKIMSLAESASNSVCEKIDLEDKVMVILDIYSFLSRISRFYGDYAFTILVII